MTVLNDNGKYNHVKCSYVGNVTTIILTTMNNQYFKAMTIYAVSAVHIFADYPYHPDIVSYHKSLESANKKADEITKEYKNAKANGWYDENVNPLSMYQSEATVVEIEVND